MKKLVFAIQVFGLIVLFPLYVAMELNQEKKELKDPQSPSVITDKFTEKKVYPEFNSNDKSKNSFLNAGKSELIN